jgi:hypothetical protein
MPKAHISTSGVSSLLSFKSAWIASLRSQRQDAETEK